MSQYSSMEEDHQEMQLLSHTTIAPLHPSSSSHPPSWPSDLPPARLIDRFDGHPSLDLQLSISLTPLKPPPISSFDIDYGNNNKILVRKVRECNINNTSSNIHIVNDQYHHHRHHVSSVEALKWQAAEQIQLAAMEKAYAERVMEMTRREMEVAQSEFARARTLWERALEEVERAEKMRERATRGTAADSTTACMEITCLSCRQKFRP